MQDRNQPKKRGRKPIEFDPDDKATNEWLKTLTPQSRNVYSGHWRKILAWTGMSGDEILASRKTDTNADWEKKVLQLKEWMKTQKDPKTGEFYSDLYARQATVALRSFFTCHRCELQPTRQEAGRLRQARRKTEDYRFSREDLRKMANIADTEEKYVVVVGKSFGLRAGDFLSLRRGHFSAVDLAQAPPDRRELNREQNKRRNDFQAERQKLFEEFGVKDVAKHRFGRALYFTDIRELAFRLRDLVVKYGGEASILEAKAIA